jgi:hypothetical protein
MRSTSCVDVGWRSEGITSEAGEENGEECVVLALGRQRPRSVVGRVPAKAASTVGRVRVPAKRSTMKVEMLE